MNLFAYIRIYPNKYTESLKLSLIALILSIGIAIAINILSIYLTNLTGNMTYMSFRGHFMDDSNMPLAFIIGLAAFLTFKNILKFYSKTINFLAAGTFGVLCIHASSDTMRQWLWQDVCNVPDMLHAPVGTLILQALIIPIIIFITCTLIDSLRRRYIERPFFNRISKLQSTIETA